MKSHNMNTVFLKGETGNTGYKTVSGDVTVLTQHEWALSEDFSETQLIPQMFGQHLIIS